jgi:lipopolysaccharide export system protein LptC
MGQGIVYLGLLALLAALSSWFLFSIEASLNEDDQAAVQLPTLYIDESLATTINEQGIRTYTLVSPHTVQLPGDQGTWLERPDIRVFQQDGQTLDWRIRSLKGWISHDNQLIRLENAVSMKRPITSGKTPVNITTRKLLVYPYKEYAETDEPTRLVSPEIVADSVGVKAWLRTEFLELLSDVRGTYEATQP